RYIAQSRRSPASPLFPYTTLFRSFFSAPRSPRWLSPALRLLTQSSFQSQSQWNTSASATSTALVSSTSPAPKPASRSAATSVTRSEEHTSELQSRENLVCRLLLEK